MKGIYVLLISVDNRTSVDVGSLGTVRLKKGLYAYVGSAQNSFEKRIARHLRAEKKKFWHIDYLLENANARVMKVFYRRAQKPEECKIAEKLGRKGFPIRGFGSSDCRCLSHLIRIEDLGFLREHMSETVVGSA
jgi:Uri superfamily endonuclease